jgi:hypothetical protein
LPRPSQGSDITDHNSDRLARLPAAKRGQTNQKSPLFRAPRGDIARKSNCRERSKLAIENNLF